MGVTILDNGNADSWKPSVRTIVSIEGNTLHFDRFLQMDYSVARQGQVFNTFPLIAGLILVAAILGPKWPQPPLNRSAK